MQKVKPGDPLTILASTWNALIDTAQYVSALRQNQGAHGIRSSLEVGIVLVRNDTGTDLAQFSAVALSDIAIRPDLNEAEFRSSPPVFLASLPDPTSLDAPFAITQEPIANGSIGRAMLLGVSPAMVDILNPSDPYVAPTELGTLETSSTGSVRLLWKAADSGPQWCLLQLGGASGGAAPPTYNGFFTIVDVSEPDGPPQIRIVDGATYDPVTHSSGTSTCKVNNVVYNVPATSIAPSSGTQYHLLRYTPATNDLPASVSFESLSSVPNDSATAVYYLIGRTFVSGNALTIQQDHTAGVAQLFWLLLCP